MIKIREVSGEIILNCFGEEEKSILEFTQGKIIMNLENQLLRYYRTACYPSTKQDLFRDIAFIIEDNRVLLEKIKKSKELLAEILDPINWAETKFRIGSSKSEGSNLSSSTSKSNTESVHREGGKSKGKADTASIARTQGAASETSELNSIDQVLDEVTINHDLLPEGEMILDDTENIWKEPTPKPSKPTPPPTAQGVMSDAPAADAPEEEEVEPRQLEVTPGTIDPLYQNFTKGVENTEDTSSSYSESTGKSIDKDKTSTEGASSGIQKNQSQRGDFTKTSTRGQETIDALNAEIKALRSKFWHKFYPIFKYERNY